MTNYTITTDAEVTININVPAPNPASAFRIPFEAVEGGLKEKLFMCRLRFTNGAVLIEQLVPAWSSQEAMEKFMTSIHVHTTGPYPGPIYGDLTMTVEEIKS